MEPIVRSNRIVGYRAAHATVLPEAVWSIPAIREDDPEDVVQLTGKVAVRERVKVKAGRRGR